MKPTDSVSPGNTAARTDAMVVVRVTGQLADATGDFACLVFVPLVASARPRVVQSASWQSASWRIRELASYRGEYVVR